jgi:hypothetical protein
MYRSVLLGFPRILFAAFAACDGGSGGSGVPPTASRVSTATVVCTQYGQLQGAVEGGAHS